MDQRFISKGFPTRPLPEDFAVRRGQLAEFVRRWLLPQERATEWACSVSGGVATLLMDCSQPWPYRGPG